MSISRYPVKAKRTPLTKLFEEFPPVVCTLSRVQSAWESSGAMFVDCASGFHLVHLSPLHTCAGSKSIYLAGEGATSAVVSPYDSDRHCYGLVIRSTLLFDGDLSLLTNSPLASVPWMALFDGCALFSPDSSLHLLGFSIILAAVEQIFTTFVRCAEKHSQGLFHRG
ncbi:unnamed protein product [Leuciscus chuanchicus]